MELHCSGINYPKKTSFFYIPYPETDHNIILINDEMLKQIDNAISQDKDAGESFINTESLEAGQKLNENIETSNTQIDNDNKQDNEIPESNHSLLELDDGNKNNSIVKYNESYNKIPTSPNLKHDQEIKMGESCFYTINDNHELESKYVKPESPQEQNIGESFIYIAYSKNSQIVKENSNMINKGIHPNNCQQINLQDNTITSLGEDMYSTVSDSKQNLNENGSSTGEEKIYSILHKKENMNQDTNFKYPAISLYNSHIKVEYNNVSTDTSGKIYKNFQEREIDFKLFEFSNTSFNKFNDYIKDGNHDHTHGRHDKGLSSETEMTANDDESDYAEPYSKVYNNIESNNQCSSADEHIYSTISDLVDSSIETSKYTVEESPSADWIHDTLAMLDSVANTDHKEVVEEEDSSEEFEDNSYSDTQSLSISDSDTGSNQLSSSCCELSYTLDPGINQSSVSSCDVRPPPLPPKNKLLPNAKSLNEISDSIGRPAYHMHLEDNGTASGVENMHEPVSQRAWETSSHDSSTGSWTQLSTINEDILQAPVPYGPPPPKPPRLNENISCINQSNNQFLKNSLRISKSLSNLPNDSDFQKTHLVTATTSVPGGVLPLFPSERQRGVEHYQSQGISPKPESFFAKIKKPKIALTKKISKSGEDMVIGQPYKFQHLNTGIDYLKNLEKAKSRNSLHYLSQDDEEDSIHEKKSLENSDCEGTSLEMEKINIDSKFTNDMKSKNLKKYMDNCKQLSDINEISNGNRVDSNKNLCDDEKLKKQNTDSISIYKQSGN